MSLDYFYDLTNLGSGIIRDRWNYNAATGIGLFTGNSGANLISRSVSGNNYEDFSLFFTYDKRQSNFNSGGVFLFSNYSGNQGFSFGLDGGNFPFLKTRGEAFSFTDINLGKKNTLCLQKSDNSFSLIRYDIPSSGIVESQSIFIGPSTPLDGGNYVFGSSSGQISGVNNFYGTDDQLLFLSEKISPENVATICSGFSNSTVIYNNFGEYQIASSEWVVPSGFGTGLQSIFSQYFTGVYQEAAIDEGFETAVNTDFVSRIYFSPVASGMHEAVNYWGEGGDGFCNTGASTVMGDTISVSGLSGYGLFQIYGNFTVGPVSQDSILGAAAEMYFTYDLSDFSPGVRYNSLMTLEFEDSVSITPNSGYFSGFEMNGIFAPESQAVLLGAFPGNSVDIGNEAVFDLVSGVFRATNVNSGLPIYLNGVVNTGFTFESDIIDIQNYVETNADDVIYDRVSGLQLIAFSNSSSATGDYYAKTSFAATGDYSFSQMYRVRESEFYETSQYHLYHGKSYHDFSSDPIFENLDENWT